MRHNGAYVLAIHVQWRQIFYKIALEILSFYNFSYVLAMAEFKERLL